jgi:outer membrane lipoprotein SlyB
MKKLLLISLATLAVTSLSGCVVYPDSYAGPTYYSAPAPAYSTSYYARPAYGYNYNAYNNYNNYGYNSGYSNYGYNQYPSYSTGPAYYNGVNVPGAVIGAGVGGILGSTIGRGNGRVAATAVGAGLGAILGAGAR